MFDDANVYIVPPREAANSLSLYVYLLTDVDGVRVYLH